MFGLNIDPNNSKGNPDPAELKKLGVEMVRYTFYDPSGGDRIDPAKAQFYKQRAQAYDQAGIGSLVILTYDTYPNKPAPEAPNPDWDRYIERFARRSGQIAELLGQWQPAFQIWNEPDHPVKGNYAPTLREEVFGRMLSRTNQAIKAVSPRATVITAGLAMGNPSWLTRVINSMGGSLPADMIVAFHPYGQRPEPSWPRPDWAFGYVGNLLKNYYRAGQKRPMWITEIGVKIEEIDNDPNKVAGFLRRYYQTIATHYSDKVEKVFWFCYSDGMVAPFGLIDGAGNRKPVYNAYREAAAAAPARQPEPATTPVTLPPAPVLTPQPSPATPSPAPNAPGTPARTSPAAPRKPVIQEIADIKDQMAQLQSQLQQLSTQPSAAAGPIAQELTQLKNQNVQLQNQMQQWQNQVAQLQSQLQRISNQQAQLQRQAQQLQSRPAPGPGAGPGDVSIPPAPSLPGAPGRPAPPIENITQQLKRHPTLRYESRPLSQIQRIIIHHTAIPPTVGAERIANYGVDKKGWAGFRYHYFITGAGQIQQTNELTTLSTHAGQYSPESVGVGFAGDFSETIPTPAQIDAGAQLIAWLLRRFNLSLQAVSGYKELVNTQSPGLQWDAGARWGDQLKERIQAYL